MASENAANGKEPCRIYRVNLDTFNIFCATWNQWRQVTYGNQAHWAIDWSQVESALNLSGIKRARWPFIFNGLNAVQQAQELVNR